MPRAPTDVEPDVGLDAGPDAELDAGSDAELDAERGLCARCRHRIEQRSARGSRFTRCARADSDARFVRYPPLPVRACEGFAPRGESSAHDGGG